MQHLIRVQEMVFAKSVSFVGSVYFAAVGTYDISRMHRAEGMADKTL